MHRIDDLRLTNRVVEGATMGGFVAALCLAIGVVRIIVALVFDRGFAELRWQDALVLAAYVGGFVTAGALLGALAPLRRTKLGALLMGILGAGTAFTAFGLGIAVYSDEYRGPDMVFVAVFCTLIFGVALAKELYEPRPPAA